MTELANQIFVEINDEIKDVERIVSEFKKKSSVQYFLVENLPLKAAKLYAFNLDLLF